MKNVLYLRLFRCFVIFFIFSLVWLNLSNFSVKLWLILLLFFLVIYFKKELFLLIGFNFKTFGIVCAMALISAVFVYRLNYQAVPEEALKEAKDIKILIIRDGVLIQDYKVVLGKIINQGELEGQYVFIKFDLLEDYKIGQIVLLKTGLKKITKTSLPFDMLFSGRVLYQVDFEEMTVLGQENQFNLFQKIANLRDKVDQKIKQVFHLKNYELVSAWLLGKTKVVDYELNDLFRRAGINHILVISGTHLSILFNVFLFLLILMPFGFAWLNFVLLIFFLLVFLLLTGMSASILRASIMWFLILLAKTKGLIINYTNILFLLVLVVALINSWVIVYDVGFHLSLLSIVSLVYIFPIILFYFEKAMLIKGKLVKYFGFVFLASLAISIGLFPYLVFVFKEFNFLSMFFNVLLMPLAAIALILVFVTLLVSFSWLFLGQILGFFSAIAIDLFMWCLTFLGDFGLRGNVLMFNLNYMVLIYYLGLFVLVVDFYKKHKKLTLNL